MKTVFSLLLAGLMVVTLTACSRTDGQGSASSSEPVQSQASAATDSADVESTQTDKSESTASAEIQSESPSGTEVSSEPLASQVQQEDTQSSHFLVTFFSATGTTKGVAETLAAGLGADLYEITPAEPYTDEDLDYNNNKSRSTIEMNDPSARPQITGSVENMDQYDIVFLGYPIWWGDAPRIMSTFVESYDFTGKTVIPFCTSGGSGIGDSGSNLEGLTSGATWLQGTRLHAGDSQETIMEWVSSLGINK